MLIAQYPRQLCSELLRVHASRAVSQPATITCIPMVFARQGSPLKSKVIQFSRLPAPKSVKRQWERSCAEGREPPVECLRSSGALYWITGTQIVPVHGLRAALYLLLWTHRRLVVYILLMRGAIVGAFLIGWLVAGAIVWYRTPTGRV